MYFIALSKPHLTPSFLHPISSTSLICRVQTLGACQSLKLVFWGLVVELKCSGWAEEAVQILKIKSWLGSLQSPESPVPALGQSGATDGFRGCPQAGTEAQWLWSSLPRRPAGTRRWAAPQHPSSSTAASARAARWGSPGGMASYSLAPPAPAPHGCSCLETKPTLS